MTPETVAAKLRDQLPDLPKSRPSESRLTEDDLFIAYRGGDGWYRAGCACGGTIEAMTAAEVDAAITAHQATDTHQEWRRWQESMKVLRRPTRHPCPCCGGDL